jgi:hypothetical protein
MTWFKRKAPPVDPNAGEGNYLNVWERKDMPDPGAQAYAWETLGLEPFSPIGPGVRTRIGIKPLFAQVYTEQAVILNGIPTTAGQIFGQPLFDPSAPGSGYTMGLALPGSPLAALNIPANYNAPIAVNDPNPGKL